MRPRLVPTVAAAVLGILAPLVVASGADAATHPSSSRPSWWNGWCDSRSNPGSHQLSRDARLWGVVACGGGSARTIRFYPGAWGEYEWQCVELVQRFLHQVYGVSPYQGNGSQVVWHYTRAQGGGLSVVRNGSGRSPVAGDVISFGAQTTYGHAAVVTAHHVNSAGTGTIRVMEENYSATGVRTIAVVHWVVQGGATGWLHKY